MRMTLATSAAGVMLSPSPKLEVAVQEDFLNAVRRMRMSFYCPKQRNESHGPANNSQN